MTRALAIIDGEHYAPVVQDALATLPYDFGGRGSSGAPRSCAATTSTACCCSTTSSGHWPISSPRSSISDEPVLGPRERFRVASRVLARRPVRGPRLSLRSARATAVRPALDRHRRHRQTGRQDGRWGPRAAPLRAGPGCGRCSDGPGGPPGPSRAAGPPVERLLELSRDGRHAASDYLEDAVFGGVDAIGCRRCGGGLAGVGVSNVAAGARLALEREPDLVIFEGSGAAFPPIATAGGSSSPTRASRPSSWPAT